MVIFYNKDLIEKDGLTIPETWEDLTKPEWKGKDCVLSAIQIRFRLHTAVHHDSGPWRQGRRMDFIKKLYDNLDGKIVDSSGKCHKMVADGEFYGTDPGEGRCAVQG